MVWTGGKRYRFGTSPNSPICTSLSQYLKKQSKLEEKERKREREKKEWDRTGGYLIRIDEEEAEPHDLDEHVLFGRRQVVPVLEHVQGDADDVAEQVLVVANLFEVFWKKIITP